MAQCKQNTPKPKDREASEERLLLAAERVFAKHGFNGATTRMIAQEADINLSLINRYFDGKYGLLMRLIETKSDEMDKEALDYPPQKTLTEECTQFALFRLKCFTKDLDIFRIVMGQFLVDPQFLKRFQESIMFSDNFPQLETRLRDLIESKKVKKSFDPNKMFGVIDLHLFGLVLSEIIVRGISVEETKVMLIDFVKAYCYHLEN